MRQGAQGVHGDLVYLVINGNRETNQHRLPTEIFVLQFQRENRVGAERESTTWCRHGGAFVFCFGESASQHKVPCCFLQVN